MPCCWSRVIYGDRAPCTCPKSNPLTDIEKLQDRVSRLESVLADVILELGWGHPKSAKWLKAIGGEDAE